MGHPGYTVDGGEVSFKGQNVLALEPDERGAAGHVPRVPVPSRCPPESSMTNFLRTALNAKRGYDGKDKSKQISPKEFRSMLKDELEVLHMDDSFLPRYINDWILRRREEARGDPPDGDAEARDRHPRRDRFRSRHRLDQVRRRGGETACAVPSSAF